MSSTDFSDPEFYGLTNHYADNPNLDFYGNPLYGSRRRDYDRNFSIRETCYNNARYSERSDSIPSHDADSNSNYSSYPQRASLTCPCTLFEKCHACKTKEKESSENIKKMMEERAAEYNKIERDYRLKEAKKFAYYHAWFILPWLEANSPIGKLRICDPGHRGFKWGDPGGLEEFYNSFSFEIERLGLLKYYNSKSEVLAEVGPPTESELLEIKETFYWNKIDNMKRQEIDYYGKLLHSPEYWKEKKEKLKEKYEP